MGYINTNNIFMDLSFPLKDCVGKCANFTENDEENNGKKLYAEIVEGSSPKWNNDKYITKMK